MRGRTAALVLVALSSACGERSASSPETPRVDPLTADQVERLEPVLGALEQGDPRNVPVFLAAGAAEVGVFADACRRLVESVYNLDPSERGRAISRGWPSCPATCPTLALLERAGRLGPTERMAFVAKECDAGDPLKLAPDVRAEMAVEDYVVARLVLEQLRLKLAAAGTDAARRTWARIDALRPRLVEGLVRRSRSRAAAGE